MDTSRAPCRERHSCSAWRKFVPPWRRSQGGPCSLHQPVRHLPTPRPSVLVRLRVHCLHHVQHLLQLRLHLLYPLPHAHSPLDKGIDNRACYLSTPEAC
jgi:hypothetical protein